MTKTDLRERVFAAADSLFLRYGSLHSFGYREVRELAAGASNDVMALFNEWKKSREEIRRSRPAAVSALADEFAGTLWLAARLLLEGQGAAGGQTPKRGSGASSVEARLQSSAAVRPPKPPRRTSADHADAALIGFTSISRPGSQTKLRARRRQEEGRAEKEKSTPTTKTANRFVLGAARPTIKRVEASAADWRGAHDPRMAEAVAKILRKKGKRLQGFSIYKLLPPSNRPGDMRHATRDLRKAVAGSKIQWSEGGWFWFAGEESPRILGWRRKTKVANSIRRGDELWWQIAHAIAKLGRPFTPGEIAKATVKQRKGLAPSWLRVRLIRATRGDDPFLREKEPGILEWTGLDPARVVKDV